MTISELSNITILSPNHSGDRTEKISKITIHHMAGNLSVESCGAIFARGSRKASSNYGIGSDGRIACYVPEEYRSWCSSSEWNDQRAITIEVANDNLVAWSISDKAYDSLIKLCADICRRYNIEPAFDGTKNGSLTAHKMFSATACPGPYILNLLENKTIENDIKKLLSTTNYGWVHDSKGWWYKNKDGSYPKLAWKKINKKWYFFNKKGYMVTGFLIDKNKIYYLEESGAMVSSINKSINIEFAENGFINGITIGR